MFQRLLKENKSFFILLFSFLAAIGIVLISIPKGNIHLFLNQFHTPFFDAFFRVITFGGDGLMPFIFGVFFLFFVSYKKAIFISLVPSIAGLVSQFFKRVLFPDVLRPKGYFKNLADLYFVPGVDVHTMHSFPSGHTTTIFSIAFCMAFFSKKSSWKMVWFVIACFVGYSRIYLSQHFLIDVYFGIILGVLTTFLLLMIYPKVKSEGLNKSLLKTIKK